MLFWVSTKVLGSLLVREPSQQDELDTAWRTWPSLDSPALGVTTVREECERNASLPRSKSTRSPLWAHSDPEPHSDRDSGNMAPGSAVLTWFSPTDHLALSLPLLV